MISLHYQLHQIQVALCVCLNWADDLDVTLLWFLLSQDDKTAEDDSINKRRRKGNNYLTEVRSPNKVSQSTWWCWAEESAHMFVFLRRNVNVITLTSIMSHVSPVSLARHQLSCHSALPAGEDGELRENKVRSMATQLLAKFEENSSTAKTRSKVRSTVQCRRLIPPKKTDSDIPASELWFTGANVLGGEKSALFADTWILSFDVWVVSEMSRALWWRQLDSLVSSGCSTSHLKGFFSDLALIEKVAAVHLQLYHCQH